MTNEEIKEFYMNTIHPNNDEIMKIKGVIGLGYGNVIESDPLGIIIMDDGDLDEDGIKYLESLVSDVPLYIKLNLNYKPTTNQTTMEN